MTRVAVLARNKSLSEGIPKAEDSWNEISQINNFVQSIDLGALNMEKGDVYSILTAVPSPWVRAYMMRNALTVEYITRTTKANPDQMIGMDGLYSALQDEYKGVLTCLALYGNRISVEKVVLEYNGEIDKEQDSQIDILKKVDNIFNIAGAFGNMLFEQKNAWGDSRKNKEDYNPPYFQLIRLDHIVVGATSPYSLLYPAASYNLDRSEVPFYKRGRFRDPLDFLPPTQLEKLHHYLIQCKKQINDFEEALGKKEPILLAVRTFINEFADETKEYIVENHPEYTIRSTGVLDYFQKFDHPFDLVFNMDMKIYKTEDGRYLNNNEGGNLKEFNPDLLLLDSEVSKVVMIDGKMGYNPNLSTVLEAQGSDGKKYYFALPLSSLGLNEFYNELSDLLDESRSDKSLTAEYNIDSESLTVCLNLTISGGKTPFYKRYSVANPREPLSTNVIIWPNFVSPNWKSYFLYSEQVHNRKGIKALPLYAEEKGVNGVRQLDNGEIYHTTQDQRKHYKKEFQADVIVRYIEDRLSERHLNYEIYQSEVPFTGVEIKMSNESLKDSCCGFVLMKKGSTNRKEMIVDYSGNREELEPVSVGLDFGSTNTTATYADHKGEQANISIKNRRRFILGREDNDNNTYANANELFFFQNDEVSKSIKSALIYHDFVRLSDPELGRSEPISGGVPIFERNLNIVGGDGNKLRLNVIKNEETELLYDLKWKREDKYLVSKKAYIKSIWLYVCAELFDQSLKPSQLLWSYPASMPKDLRKTYEGLYKEVLDTVNPLPNFANTKLAKITDNRKDELRAISESEAVCNYALSAGGVGLGSSSILVGIDIGGVTSDLLILANDPGDSRAILLKQSSVKLAANKLSTAIGKSKDLQKCISHFVRKNQLEIPALENINSETSNYLTNLLFEEIEDNDVLERSFYSELWNPENEQLNRDETRGLIAVSAYICGLLLFHAGQLVRSVMEKDKSSKSPRFADIHDGFYLNVACFGKGGKLFAWLPTALNDDDANKFYQDCFNSGYRIEEKESSSKSGNPIKVFNLVAKPKHLKMEVGFGLTSPKGAITVDENAHEEILGEEGYVFRSKEGKTLDLNWDSPVNSNHIFEFGEDLVVPVPQEDKDGKRNTGLVRFEKFKNIYLDLVKDWDLFDHSRIHDQSPDFAQIKLETYVKRDEDWKAGKKLQMRTGDDSDFLFSCSPFLYQGMCYLDEIVMKNIYPNIEDS